MPVFGWSLNIPKLLRSPTDFSDDEALRAILRMATRYYQLRRTRKLEVVGQMDNSSSPAYRVAIIILQDIRNGQYQEEKEVKGAFSRLFDNELLRISRLNPFQAERILTFFITSCEFLVSRDPVAKAVGLSEEQRWEAFRRATEKLWKNMRSPHFEFQKGASILFRKIFRDECHSLRRNTSTGKELMNRAFLTVSDDQRHHDDLSAYLHPAVNLSMEDVLKIRAFHPWCYDLVVAKSYEGYTYEQLVDRFGHPAERLRKKASECRRKLYAAYLKLNKLPNDE